MITMIFMDENNIFLTQVMYDFLCFHSWLT